VAKVAVIQSSHRIPSGYALRPGVFTQNDLLLLIEITSNLH